MKLSGIAPQLLPDILENLPQLVWLTSADGSMVYVNGYGREYLGVEQDAVAGWKWLQTVHPADREAAMHAWIEATTSKKPFQTKYRMLNASGQYRWNLVRAQPVFDDQTNISAYIGTCTDVEDWKRTLRDLSTANREIEELLAILNVYESRAPVGFGYVDLDFRYRRVNESLAMMNGLTVAEHLGRTIREVLPKLWVTVQPLFQKVIETRQPLIEREITGETRAFPGELHVWTGSYYPVQIAGELVGVAMIMLEVTRVRRLERALHRYEPEAKGCSVDSSLPLRDRQLAAALREFIPEADSDPRVLAGPL